MQEEIQEPKPKKATQRRSRTPDIINVRQVKRMTLEFARELRAQNFTRVADSHVNALRADFRNMIRQRVMRHPSVGKTIK